MIKKIYYFFLDKYKNLYNYFYLTHNIQQDSTPPSPNKQYITYAPRPMPNYEFPHPSPLPYNC
jgi:hypothetical protein